MNGTPETRTSLTVGTHGQITISAGARERLSIAPGQELLELVVGSVLVYVPEDVVFNRAQDAFLSASAARGITADDVLAQIQSENDVTPKLTRDRSRLRHG